MWRLMVSLRAAFGGRTPSWGQVVGTGSGFLGEASGCAGVVRLGEERFVLQGSAFSPSRSWRSSSEPPFAGTAGSSQRRRPCRWPSRSSRSPLWRAFAPGSAREVFAPQKTQGPGVQALVEWGTGLEPATPSYEHWRCRECGRGFQRLPASGPPRHESCAGGGGATPKRAERIRPRPPATGWHEGSSRRRRWSWRVRSPRSSRSSTRS